MNGLPKVVPLSLPYQDFKKDMSHSKEKLRVPLRIKRVEFSTVVLTAPCSLPGPQIEINGQAEEDIEDDVDEEEEEEAEDEEGIFQGEEVELHSGSSSDVSQKSTERSQDGAPSTLLADDQKDSKGRASMADNDLELEEGSKTLVLFSPGDMKKSPVTHELIPDVDLGTLAALTPQSERPQPTVSQLDVSEPGTLSSVLKSEPKPPVAPATASSPFTKVERTFVHIAEKSHLNVMSSSGQMLRHEDCCPPGQFEEPIVEEEYELLKENGSVNSAVEVGEIESCASFANHIETSADMAEEAPALSNGFNLPEEHIDRDSLELVSEDTGKLMLEEQGLGKTALATERLITPEASREGLKQNLPMPFSCRFKSRIPVLLSEEETGSDLSGSHSVKERFPKRAKQPDLARLVMEKRQNRLMRMASGASSSASSSDERRCPSETLSTAGSEEDTHDSEKLGKAPLLRKEDSTTSTKSRIPRPITPTKTTSSDCKNGSHAPAPWAADGGSHLDAVTAVRRHIVLRSEPLQEDSGKDELLQPSNLLFGNKGDSLGMPPVLLVMPGMVACASQDCDETLVDDRPPSQRVIWSPTSNTHVDQRSKQTPVRQPSVPASPPPRSTPRRTSFGPPRSPLPPSRNLSTCPRSPSLTRTESPSPSRQRRQAPATPRGLPPLPRAQALIPSRDSPVSPSMGSKGQRVRPPITSPATKGRPVANEGKATAR